MSDYVKVDASGRLVPEDDNVRQRLAARSGRYYFTPTSSDLLVFVRSPPSGGKATPPRVVLAGDISGLHLVELIEFIHQTRRTGVLRVLAPSGERAIAFHEGEVRGAVSDDARERLGEVAVRLGFCDRETVEKIAAERPTQLGRMLVDRGVLKPHDLWKCLQQQVAEIFHGMLLSREGAFVVLEQTVEDRGSALSLNTQGLLMDSIRRIDEMAEFRKRLPSDDAYLVPIKPPGSELDADERRVFELCNGSRSLAEVAQAARLSEFEALKTVYHLVQGRYVSTVESAAPAPDQKPERTPERVAGVFNVVFREIRNAVAKTGVATEFITAANSAVSSQSEAVRRLFEDHGFKNDGTLDTKVLLANAKAASLDADAIHAALSEAMFFLLFQAGELLDPKADEELARRVKSLLAEAT
jgi:hypothetical protein